MDVHGWETYCYGSLCVKVFVEPAEPVLFSDPQKIAVMQQKINKS